MKMKNFLDMPYEEFKKTIPWNLNFHCFEGLDNSQAIYLWAAEEAYHCLIDCFSSFPSNDLCFAKDRLDHIRMFSFNDFKDTFNLTENAKYVSKFAEFSFEDFFFVAVEDLFNIFQFMKHYQHPKVKNGDTVLQHPSFEKDLVTHYVVEIDGEINVKNSEGYFLPKGILNTDNKTFVYLDEIFGILSIAEGYFLTIKSK